MLGGGFRMGRETCLALAGTRVNCRDLDAGRADAMAAEMKGEAQVADVTDRKAVERLFAEVLKYTSRVDCAVEIVGRADSL